MNKLVVVNFCILLLLFSCNHESKTELQSNLSTENDSAVVVIAPKSVIESSNQIEESKNPDWSEEKWKKWREDLDNIGAEVAGEMRNENGEKTSIEHGGCYVCGKYISIHDRKKAEYKTQVGYDYKIVYLCPDHFEMHVKKGMNW